MIFGWLNVKYLFKSLIKIKNKKEVIKIKLIQMKFYFEEYLIKNN